MRAALLLSALLVTVADPASAQIATFGEGTPTHLDPVARQSTGNRILEQLLGNDAMEPVAELAPSDIMRKLAAPVGRLTITFKGGTTAPGETGGYCTASLIDRDLILTNHHCVPGRGNVEQAWLTMGYLKPRSRSGVAQFPVKLPPVEASEALDYAILRVDGNPGAEWGTIALSGSTPDALNSLFLIHHPRGFPLYVTRGRCQTSEPAVDGSDLLHTCDTEGGSSGAPIFDNNSRLVVGLHYGGVALRKLNAGKRIASIAEASPIVAGILKRAAAASTPDASKEADELKALRERLASLEAQMKQAPPAPPAPVAPPVASRPGKLEAPKVAEAPKVEPPKPAPAPAAAPTPAPAPVASTPGKRALSTGALLEFDPMGIESRVIGFIEDGARPVDKLTWFDFDRLNFKTGSADLTAESMGQVKNMYEILRAYPAVQLKIGGYTDNVGDPEKNMKLSHLRAQSVVTELVTLGVGGGRLEAEGYGEQHPIASNDTAEGRAKNRRISVRVTAK